MKNIKLVRCCAVFSLLAFFIFCPPFLSADIQVDKHTEDGKDIWSFVWHGIVTDYSANKFFRLGGHLYPSGEASFTGSSVSEQWSGYDVYSNFSHPDPFGRDWSDLVGVSDANGNLCLTLPSWVDGVAGYWVTSYSKGQNPLSFTIKCTFTGPTQGIYISSLYTSPYYNSSLSTLYDRKEFAQGTPISFWAILSDFEIYNYVFNFTLTDTHGNEIDLGPGVRRVGSLSSGDLRFYAKIRWDGKIDGSLAPSGTYYITAETRTPSGKSSKTTSFQIIGDPIIEWVEVSPANWEEGIHDSLEIKARSDEAAKIDISVTPPDSETPIYLATDLATDDSNSIIFNWDGILPGEDSVLPGDYIAHAQTGGSIKSFNFSMKTDLKVTSIESIPNRLWIDHNGASSGIVAKAVTTEDTEVTFKIITSLGSEILLGRANTINKIAKISWWGFPDMPKGTYELIAEIPDHSKSTTFTVKEVGVDLTGLGKWMKESKDPSAVLPPFAAAEVCPLQSWEQMLSLETGYFNNLSVSDPVNISLGNYCLPEVDFALKDRRSLAVARIYNSFDPKISPFGRGWSSPLLVNLEIAENYVVFTNSDGSKLLFNKSGNTFTPASPTELKLEYNSDTEFFTLSHPTGTNWIFNNNGQIVQMLRSCCGQGASDAIIFSYDASGKLVTVAIPSGKSITLTYNAENLIIAITDSTGRIFNYSYDDNKNLVSFKDPLIRETTYSYDEFGFMTGYNKPGNKINEITYAVNRVTNIKDPTGAQSIFVWDTDNNKLTLTDFAGVAHEYSFDDDWRISSYAVPAINLNKEFTAVNGRITASKDSLGFSDGYAYDENGFYSSHTDKLGNVTTFEWHPTLHKLTRKTDALGREWSYEWCARGNLIKKVDPAGNETTYTYDAYNNRTSKTDPLGRLTRYIYDSTGNYLVQTIDAMGGVSSFTYDARGNLTTSTDQLGRTTTHEYDILDRLIKTTYPDGRYTQLNYDEAGNIVSRVDNLGRITAYTYDANGKLLTTTRPDGTILSHEYDAAGRKIRSTDALGRVTAYEYDALDNLGKVTYPDQTYKTYTYDTEKRLVSSTDELGNLTAYEYDPMGRMLASIDPAGNRHANQYDAVGRKITQTDPKGRTTNYDYDVLNRVIKTTFPDLTTNTSSYDALGNLLVATNALNQQTVYEYDALNRRVKTTRADGAEFTTVFDAAGQVISEIDALGNTTAYGYDNSGRRTSITNAAGNTWHYDYDNAGRLIKTTDPLGGITALAYDNMNRLISETDPLGRTTSYEYDAAGKRVARTDAMGRRSITAYDDRDRLTTEIDAGGRIVSYGYDAAGRKTRLTDGAGRNWRWVYDALGRVTAEIDPLGNQVKSSYDAVGNLTLKTNARAQATAYEYDLMNRLVKINYPDSTAATFAYDALGREILRSGTAETVEKAYDVAGNLISENFVNQNKGWSYSFDLMGNRIQAVSPENETFKYKYDNLYRLVELDTGKASEKINYTYDALGRNIEEKRVDSTTANSFDSAGQLLEMKHYRLVNKQKSKGLQRHKNVGAVNQPPTEEIIALRSYSYDPAGNRINMTDENGKVTSYEYDNSNWLTKVVYPNADVVTYAYNAAGDRISEQLNEKTSVVYEYDAAGRMLSKGSETFSYDADGNMLTDSVATYTWNSDNRLVRIEKTSGGCKHTKDRLGHGFGHLKHGKDSVVYEEYAYLPQDWRRITRKTGKYKINRRGDSRIAQKEQTFVSIYDGDDESHEYLLRKSKFKFRSKRNSRRESLKLFREFVGGPDTDDIKHTRYNKLSLAMLKDGLGSTIALTGKEARPIARINYDAWGEFRYENKLDKAPCKNEKFDDYLKRLEGTRGFGRSNHNARAFGKHFGSKLTPYLYTGRRYSETTSQYFNRNRYYSPALGRFTTKDPIGFNGDINLYRYADNNPIRWVDPWGLFIEMPINDQARAELLLISETFLQTAPSDYRFAVRLFQHSLQDSPENLIFSESSWQSDYLRQSRKLESEIEKFVLTLPNGGSAIDVINVSVLLNSPRSYFYAINKALINMKGSICKTSNAQFDLELDSLIVKDVYDFADMGNKDFYRKEIAVAANQLAFSYQESGVIVPYRWYAKLGNYKLSR